MINEFREEMIREGLNPPQQINADGEFHRFSSNQEKNDKAGWYILNDHPIMFGAFGCWRRGTKKNWSASQVKKLNSEDRLKYQQIIDQQKAKIGEIPRRCHQNLCEMRQKKSMLKFEK